MAYGSGSSYLVYESWDVDAVSDYGDAALGVSVGSEVAEGNWSLHGWLALGPWWSDDCCHAELLFQADALEAEERR